MRYFDSHAHYWDDRFRTEIEGDVDSLLDTLLETTVDGIVNVGTTVETTLAAIRQAKAHKGMYVAGGVHPSDARGLPLDETLDALKTLLIPENKVVALGEIGLDYHYTPFDKQEQLAFFHAQMKLAREFHLPVIIHDREAHGDSFEVVRAYPDVKGVFHSYSGSKEMARQLVSMGYMISFSGTVSFKNAPSVKEVAASIPKDAILIETDAPYLAPHPYRGRLNHSGYLAYTAQAIANLWGASLEELAHITAENAKRFFDIKE